MSRVLPSVAIAAALAGFVPAVSAQDPQAPGTPRATFPANAFAPDPIAKEAEEVNGDSAAQTEDEPSDETIASLSKRLAEMEEQWTTFRDELDKEAAAAEDQPTMEIGGRIHLDYWSFLDQDQGIHYLEHPNPGDAAFGTDPEDRWAFRRIRLEMAGTVPQNMLWRIQIDFNQPSEPDYKDVYLGWTELPNNQTLLLGNQKRPIGLDHLNSSRFNVFAERPLAVEAFNEDARRIGLAMYGYDAPSSVNWTYGVFNLENTSETGRFIGDSLQLGGYGRLAASPWYDEISGGRGYQHLGIAGSIARPDGDASAADSNTNEARFRTRPQARTDSRWLDTGRIAGAEAFEQIGVESITNLGALQITGEYLATAVQRDAVGGPDDGLVFHGGYIYASYFLTGEFIPYDRESGTIDRVIPFENFFLVDCCNGGRGKGWGAWQIAARYDYLDLTDSNILGGVQHNYTLGLNWHWNAYAKLQSNLIYGTIDEHRPIVDPFLGRSFTGGDFWILGTRFMIDF